MKEENKWKAEAGGSVMERVQQKIAEDFIPRCLCFTCPCVVSVEILGLFAWQEEEEANRKLTCLLGGIFQDRFVKYALHIHLATEKRK